MNQESQPVATTTVDLPKSKHFIDPATVVAVKIEASKESIPATIYYRVTLVDGTVISSGLGGDEYVLETYKHLLSEDDQKYIEDNIWDAEHHMELFD